VGFENGVEILVLVGSQTRQAHGTAKKEPFLRDWIARAPKSVHVRRSIACQTDLSIEPARGEVPVAITVDLGEPANDLDSEVGIEIRNDSRLEIKYTRPIE
jgi:hypothetical protein